MKTTNSKFSVLALLLLLCVLLTSCDFFNVMQQSTSTDRTTTDRSDGEEPSPDEEDLTLPGKLTLAKNGKTDYTLIFPLGAAAWKRDLVLWFREVFYQVTGAQLAIRDDFEAEDEPDTLRTDREIVIGMGTSREDSFSYDATQFEKGYSNFISNERVVLVSGSHAGMYLGICRFFKDVLGVDVTDEEAITGKTDCIVDVAYTSMEYVSNPAFYFMEQDVGNYKILVDPSDDMQLRMAYVLQSRIESATGQLLPLSGDAPTEGAPEIVLITDGMMQKGTWSMKIENNRFTVRAGDYYGFTGVSEYFLQGTSHGFYPQFLEGFAVTHSYKDHLGAHSRSTAYAYDHTGDARIMFYNVLFNSPIPAARNVLNAELIEQYMPDVLGLQEFNNTKRYQAGDRDLGKLLAKLGYVETIDPRVKNAYATNKTIPGTTQKGYGTGGAARVTVDGETFYTYYNHTPLFYNPQTTDYIDGGYYWYQSQRDSENKNNCGSSDCASKSLTWGVFADKRTGERYIAVSTHMCTRSEGVRGQQALEVLALLDQILQQYDCPVFFGGDYNGSFSNINHKLFEEQGDLVDIGREDVAEILNGAMGTMHAAPVAGKDSLTGRDFAVGRGGYTDTYSSAVDHIMVRNLKGARIKVFGVVVDEYANAGSDHLPIFVDFSFS